MYWQKAWKCMPRLTVSATLQNMFEGTQLGCHSCHQLSTCDLTCSHFCNFSTLASLHSICLSGNVLSHSTSPKVFENLYPIRYFIEQEYFDKSHWYTVVLLQNAFIDLYIRNSKLHPQMSKRRIFCVNKRDLMWVMAIPYYFINILIDFITLFCSYFASLLFKKGNWLNWKIKIHNEEMKNETHINIFFSEEMKTKLSCKPSSS